MRIFFAGTPDIAVPSLEKLSSVYDICGVLTNPDRPKGRKGIITPSPVKSKAIELGLDIYQPEKLDSIFVETVRKLNPDILVTFAYGKIFKKDFLDIFTKEALNIHPSLLPEFRGAAPIPAAILAGKRETGITVQRMSLKMDSGDIIDQFIIPLDGTETTESLSIFVSEKSSDIIIEVIEKIKENNYSAVPQKEEEASYCSMINKKDGLIDWSKPADIIERMIRGYNPWPHAYTYYKEKLLVISGAIIYKDDVPERDPPYKYGEVVFVNKKEGIIIKTGDGFLALKKIKPQSKKEMDFKSFINGVRDFEGTVLGE